MLTPTWVQIFVRAIGANWLVCFAVYISIPSREIVSKIGAIWWPTLTFVALGLEHVIANMYFNPVVIFYGHPDIGVGLYIWKSMIPTALGNTLGGGLFVGGMYWYLYLTGPGSEDIKSDVGDLDSAMEVVGLLAHRFASRVPSLKARRRKRIGHLPKGRSRERATPIMLACSHLLISRWLVD